jgi:hypothetical protein
VPDFLALPIVVVLLVAVKTPEDSFTAVNPFCEADKVYFADVPNEP